MDRLRTLWLRIGLYGMAAVIGWRFGWWISGLLAGLLIAAEAALAIVAEVGLLSLWLLIMRGKSLGPEDE
jgi:hypothetical protein